MKRIIVKLAAGKWSDKFIVGTIGLTMLYLIAQLLR